MITLDLNLNRLRTYFMKFESISIESKDATQSGVGKEFLIISITLTVILNLSPEIWYFMNKMGRFLVK